MISKEAKVLLFPVEYSYSLRKKQHFVWLHTQKNFSYGGCHYGERNTIYPDS
jgi:hypothetical protein